MLDILFHHPLAIKSILNCVPLQSFNIQAALSVHGFDLHEFGYSHYFCSNLDKLAICGFAIQIYSNLTSVNSKGNLYIITYSCLKIGNR